MIIVRRSSLSGRNGSAGEKPRRSHGAPLRRLVPRQRSFGQATIEAVHATAETLEATLEHMKVVEEMRRTIRNLRDVNKLDSN
jgi:hypothetical protein